MPLAVLHSWILRCVCLWMLQQMLLSFRWAAEPVQVV